jgi:hypothetical protein
MLRLLPRNARARFIHQICREKGEGKKNSAFAALEVLIDESSMHKRATQKKTSTIFNWAQNPEFSKWVAQRLIRRAPKKVESLIRRGEFKTAQSASSICGLGEDGLRKAALRALGSCIHDTLPAGRIREIIQQYGLAELEVENVAAEALALCMEEERFAYVAQASREYGLTSLMREAAIRRAEFLVGAGRYEDALGFAREYALESAPAIEVLLRTLSK